MTTQHSLRFTSTLLFAVLTLLVIPTSLKASKADVLDQETQGIDYYLKGDQEKAIQFLEQAWSSGQSSPKCKAYLIKAYLEKAHDDFSNEDYKSSMAVLESALKIDPDNREIKDVYLMVKNVLDQPKVKTEYQTHKTKSAETEKAAPQIIEKVEKQVFYVNATASGVSKESLDAIEQQFVSLRGSQQKAIDDLANARSSARKIVFVTVGVALAVIVVLLLLMGRQQRHFKDQETRLLGILHDQESALAQGKAMLASSQLKNMERVTTKDMLADNNPRIRARGIELLAQELIQQKVSADNAEKILRPFSTDPNNRVRGNVAWELYKFKPENAKRLMRSMLSEPDEYMQLSAIWVCGEIGDPETVDWLVHFSQKTTPRLKVSIARSLEKILALDHSDLKQRKTELQDLVHKLYQESKVASKGDSSQETIPVGHELKELEKEIASIKMRVDQLDEKLKSLGKK